MINRNQDRVLNYTPVRTFNIVRGHIMFEVPPTYYLNYYITLETPFSNTLYSFHNSSSRSSHHPCLVSVLQPASPPAILSSVFFTYSYQPLIERKSHSIRICTVNLANSIFSKNHGCWGFLFLT